MPNDNLVRVERNRGRVSLGRLVPDLQPGDLFTLTVEDDGTIIMRPVSVVPAKGSKRGRT